VTDLNLDHFIELETRVWEALVAGDPKADEAALSADFLGVYPSGFANRDEHTAQLADGPTVASYELSDEQVFAVSDTSVMFCYRADYTRIVDGAETEPEAMYVSSLWCSRDGNWLNTFSQDTPAR